MKIHKQESRDPQSRSFYELAGGDVFRFAADDDTSLWLAMFPGRYKERACVSLKDGSVFEPASSDAVVLVAGAFVIGENQ